LKPKMTEDTVMIRTVAVTAMILSSRLLFNVKLIPLHNNVIPTINWESQDKRIILIAAGKRPHISSDRRRLIRFLAEIDLSLFEELLFHRGPALVCHFRVEQGQNVIEFDGAANDGKGLSWALSVHFIKFRQSGQHHLSTWARLFKS